MKSRAVLRFAFILLGLLAAGLEPSLAEEAANPQRYLSDVKTLASDGMEGRGAGTSGLQQAGKYIEEQFKQLGLRPAGTQGFRQPFTVTTGARLKDNNLLRVRLGDRESTLKLSEDYIPLSFSSVGSMSEQIVFAGYGATAPEFQYDDYANLDVKGKVVVVLRYEPESFEHKAEHAGPTQHSHLITKAINARNHGAKAVILVNGHSKNSGESDTLIRFGSQAGPKDSGVLLVQVKNTIVEEWIKSAGKSLADLQKEIDRDGKPRSFAVPTTIRLSLNVDIESARATVDNVLAYLPGKSSEYVILGAHYDHLGRGDSNSLAPSQIGEIHHGADDNASGTAGLLELARMFSHTKHQRGILFMSFAGEELGLLGSSEWVAHPTLPLDKAVAMLNMDMIGRMKDSKLYIGGIGTGSTFKAIIDPLAAKYHLTTEQSRGGYSASDHTSFVGKGIPVLFFFSGLHSDYHKPSDTWDKIDANSAVKVVDLVADVTNRLTSGPERPQFAKVEEETPHGGSGGGGGYGPYFGSIPDFGEIPNGVKFADVRPGSPAAKAGLKPGDILVQFAGKPIKNLYDFTDALRRSKVGEVVEVKVLRGDESIAAQVKLEERR